MKKLWEFSNLTEAQIFSGYLNSHGVTHSIDGHREYTTIVLGGTGGRYNILVPDEEFESARKLLIEYRSSHTTEETTESTSLILKKALFHGLLGIIFIPFLFHYFSIKKSIQYWKAETKLGSKIFWMLVLVFLWILGFAVAGFTLRGIFY